MFSTMQEKMKSAVSSMEDCWVDRNRITETSSLLSDAQGTMIRHFDRAFSDVNHGHLSLFQLC